MTAALLLRAYDEATRQMHAAERARGRKRTHVERGNDNLAKVFQWRNAQAMKFMVARLHKLSPSISAALLNDGIPAVGFCWFARLGRPVSRKTLLEI